MKIFSKAPLPFVGQKRYFLKLIMKEMSLMIEDADTTIIDLFGGSGLITHNVKRRYPNNRVIYNDFDDYSSRLRNIESLRPYWMQLLNVFKRGSYYNKQHVAVGSDAHAQIISILKSLPNNADIRTISSWINFPGRPA